MQATYEYPFEEGCELNLPDDEWPVDGQEVEVGGRKVKFGAWDLTDGTATADMRQEMESANLIDKKTK